jgi:uncharacterized protein YdeI (YjbR/CyaY-like superfamily)
VIFRERQVSLSRRQVDLSHAKIERFFRSSSEVAAWDEWLAANHGLHQGVWLKIAKQRTGIASVTNDEAVDVGLCWVRAT